MNLIHWQVIIQCPSLPAAMQVPPLGEVHQAGSPLQWSLQKVGWWCGQGGALSSGGSPVPDPLEARVAHADGTRALGRCQPQPGIRLAALELPCMSVTPHAPCFTWGNLSPSPPTPHNTAPRARHGSEHSPTFLPLERAIPSGTELMAHFQPDSGPRVIPQYKTLWKKSSNRGESSGHCFRLAWQLLDERGCCEHMGFWASFQVGLTVTGWEGMLWTHGPWCTCP